MKIAIIGETHISGWDILKKNNFNVFEIKDFNIESLKKNLSDVDGILLRTSELRENVLSNCKNLKIIARHGVGYDNVDLSYLNNNNIALSITGTSNAVTVAEYVLSSFLSLSRNTYAYDQLVKNGDYKKKKSMPDFFELYKKNILIFGFGRIGKAVAKRCLGFEATVYVYDPFIKDKEIEKANCVPISKNDGIEISDFITIHLPLNADTKNFISENEFSKMKKSVVIVNAARGGIVNENALVSALSNKTIRAAALDVYEQEPPPDNHPIFGFSNVLLSPHNSALTLECRRRMAIEAAESIFYYLSDKSKLNFNNIINKDVLNI